MAPRVPKQRRRPPSEWLRLPAEELRIVSDALWEAAHKRLARTRNTFRPTRDRMPGQLDLASPYLLSGLGRCTICGGSVIAMGRHHGPSAWILLAAVNRAFELFEEHRQNAMDRRKIIEKQLRTVTSEEARLVDTVKRTEHIEALVAALQSAQERRRALETQLASASAAVENVDTDALRRKLLKRAADVRGVLARRAKSETRGVLQVFAERIEFAPFNETATRGYEFVGNGSYGQILLGDTCPTSSGGPREATVRGVS